MEPMLQQWIWLDALRTNWRAIHLRLVPATPALVRDLAAIFARFKVGAPPEEVAVILDDLMDLIDGTEAAEFVRGLLARNTLPETPSPLTVREEILALNAPTETFVPVPGLESTGFSEAAVVETGKALGGSTIEPGAIVGVRVFFATNREATNSHMPGEKFGSGCATRTAFGKVSVSIPVSHKKGRIEKPGFFENQTMQDHFVISRDLKVLDIVALQDELTQQIGSGSNRDLLVFIHGFNVTFEDALLRAAQLKYDLNFSGEIVLFTWPSRGSLFRYTADHESAETSGLPLAEFLAAIVEGPWRRVHLLAHSMGGRVLVGGLGESAAPRKGVGQVALVAADVRNDFFTQQFPKFAALGDGKTSYVASKDLALWASTKINLRGRIGFIDNEPFVIDEPTPLGIRSSLCE